MLAHHHERKKRGNGRTRPPRDMTGLLARAGPRRDVVHASIAGWAVTLITTLPPLNQLRLTLSNNHDVVALIIIGRIFETFWLELHISDAN